MANPGADLHALIHSMDKQEKIWFRQQHQRKGEPVPDFIRLYEAIGEQEAYDEHILREMLGNHPLVRRLAPTKHYLYQRLLEDLATFHRKHDPYAQVHAGLDMLRLLRRKGLRKAAGRLLRKLKLQAANNQFLMLELLEWERANLGFASGQAVRQESIRDIYAQTDSILQTQLRLNRLHFLSSTMFHLLSTRGKPRTEEERSVFRACLEDNVMQEVQPTDSVQVRAQALLIRSLWHQVNGDAELSYACRKEIADLYAARAEVPEGIREYMSAVNNLMIGQIALAKYDECQEYLDKLKRIADSLGDRKPQRMLRNDLMVRYYIFRLLVAERQRRFEEVVEMLPGIQALLEQADEIDDPGKIHLIVFNTACNLTAIGQYRAAIQWWNRILQEPDTAVRQDLYVFARLLHLLCHYSLGNYDVIRFLLPGIYRYLHRHRQLYRFEEILLDTFRKFNRIRTPRQERQALIDFRDRLEVLFKEPEERRVLDYFDILRWLDKKLTSG